MLTRVKIRFLSSSLWGVPGLFPEGVSVPRAPALCPRYTCGPRVGQQGGVHCPIRPGGLHRRRRGGCSLRGSNHPQGGGLRPIRGRAGVQGQILRLLFLDSEFNRSETSLEPYFKKSSSELVSFCFFCDRSRSLILTTRTNPSMAAMRPKPTGWGNFLFYFNIGWASFCFLSDSACVCAAWRWEDHRTTFQDVTLRKLWYSRNEAINRQWK